MTSKHFNADACWFCNMESKEETAVPVRLHFFGCGEGACKIGCTTIARVIAIGNGAPHDEAEYTGSAHNGIARNLGLREPLVPLSPR